MSEVVALIIIN